MAVCERPGIERQAAPRRVTSWPFTWQRYGSGAGVTVTPAVLAAVTVTEGEALTVVVHTSNAADLLPAGITRATGHGDRSGTAHRECAVPGLPAEAFACRKPLMRIAGRVNASPACPASPVNGHSGACRPPAKTLFFR